MHQFTPQTHSANCDPKVIDLVLETNAFCKTNTWSFAIEGDIDCLTDCLTDNVNDVIGNSGAAASMKSSIAARREVTRQRVPWLGR